MYSYEWDASTGGYILNSTPLAFSKEPRPVYYKELDILGFDAKWNYPKSDAYGVDWLFEKIVEKKQEHHIKNTFFVKECKIIFRVFWSTL